MLASGLRAPCFRKRVLVFISAITLDNKVNTKLLSTSAGDARKVCAFCHANASAFRQQLSANFDRMSTFEPALMSRQDGNRWPPRVLRVKSMFAVYAGVFFIVRRRRRSGVFSRHRKRNKIRARSLYVALYEAVRALALTLGYIVVQHRVISW